MYRESLQTCLCICNLIFDRHHAAANTYLESPDPSLFCPAVPPYPINLIHPGYFRPAALLLFSLPFCCSTTVFSPPCPHSPYYPPYSPALSGISIVSPFIPSTSRQSSSTPSMSSTLLPFNSLTTMFIPLHPSPSTSLPSSCPIHVIPAQQRNRNSATVPLFKNNPLYHIILLLFFLFYYKY